MGTAGSLCGGTPARSEADLSPTSRYRLRMNGAMPPLAQPFNIIDPFMPSFENLAFFSTFPHVNPACPFLLPYMCYAFRSFHPLLCNT